jgi:primosomal protein N' (replication factor Y) (superfamily II helicase)
MDKKIAKVLVGLPLEGPFDYRVGEDIKKDIQPGCRVWVQFGFRKMVGYVVGFSAKSRFNKVRPISALIDRVPVLGPDILKLTKDFADYYCCTWAEAIEASLPEGIRKGRAVSIIEKKIETALPRQFQATLIHDFSREKYFSLLCAEIKSTLKNGQGILYLLPEVNQLKARQESLSQAFSARFAVWDREKGAKEKLEEWQKIKNGEVDIVLGTRSAVFVPLSNLGLIILEDEDNAAFKQEQGPFYHAREVALMRSRQEKLRLVFAGRTPSLEVVYLTKSKDFKLISPAAKTSLPRAQIIDLNLYRRKKDAPTLFSLPLQESLQQAMAKGERAILFINRKGFSTFMRCKKCGFSLKCPRCNVSLTFHYDKHKLICRYCHYRTEPLELCPQCNSDYIRYMGVGTEKIESDAHRIFPQAKILRLDSDRKIKPENFNLLIATQIIFKEPTQVSADLVAALQIDTALNRLDFRAAEKTFSILVQLSALAKQKLVIQTHNPQHYSIQAAATADYGKFYKQELQMRRSLKFPPFRHFVSVMLRGKIEEKVKTAATFLYEVLDKSCPKSIELFEVQPDIPAKLRGNYRWCILLKGKNIKELNRLIRAGIKKIKQKSGIIVGVNVDI